MAPASPLLALLGDGDDLERVETALRSSVETGDADPTDIASHLIRAGGKRLRPACTVVAASAVRPDATPHGRSCRRNSPLDVDAGDQVAAFDLWLHFGRRR